MTHEPTNEDDEGGERSDKRSQSALQGMKLVKEALPLIGLLLLPGFALRALVFADFDPTVAARLFSSRSR